VVDWMDRSCSWLVGWGIGLDPWLVEWIGLFLWLNGWIDLDP
jgi:hypothetical protein